MLGEDGAQVKGVLPESGSFTGMWRWRREDLARGLENGSAGDKESESGF